jgi:hypothetical protein
MLLYVHINSSSCLCTYVYAHLCLYVCTQVNMYTYACICEHACMYVCVYARCRMPLNGEFVQACIVRICEDVYTTCAHVEFVLYVKLMTKS